MTSNLEFIDLIIIGVYFIAVLGIGFYFARRERTSTDYFLAGRDVGWLAIGASLFASNISSEHFIGLAGTGANSGLAVGHFEFQATLFCLMLGWLFAPFYLRAGVFTMPEFLERRFGSSCRWYLTGVSVIGYILTKISVTLYAGGLLLQQVVGWDMVTSSLVLVIATGVYTIAGGLAAVIYTELIQTFVLIIGALVLTAIGFWQVGGWQGLTANIDPEFFNMFKPIDHPDFPWTGVIFGAPLVGMWYWCTDQFIVQRVLSAKNRDNALSGAIFAGYLKQLPLFIMILPGIIAAALFQEELSAGSDMAYPVLVTELLPVGLKGIVIAGLLAAIMSSLASCFNSSSTLITMDIYKKLKPQASERELVFSGRIFTTVLVVLGILWIPFITNLSDQLYVYLQSVQAYIAPPITAVFLFGVFFARLNTIGAFTTLVGGFVLGALRLTIEIMANAGTVFPEPIQTLATMNFLHFAILLFVVCVATLFIVSYATSPLPREQIRGLTYATAYEGMTEEQLLQESRKGHWFNVALSVMVVLFIVVVGFIFSPASGIFV